jgi:hypothetical protein
LRFPPSVISAQSVASSLLEVRSMLAMSQDPVEVPEVVARALVPMVHVLDEQASPLAVLFSFVVLLSILDEATLPMICGVSPRQLRGLRGRAPLGAGLHLLA